MQSTSCSLAAVAAVAAAAALLAGAPARADVWARASVTGFGYSLVDLRPGDGIAPAIRFNTPAVALSGGSSVNVWAQEEATPYDLSASDGRLDGFRSFRPMAASAATPTVEADAHLSGTLARHRFSIVAEGSLLNGAAGTDLKEFHAWADSASRYMPAFELTPFTRVVFTGQSSYALRRTVEGPSSLREIGHITIDAWISTAPRTVFIQSGDAEVRPGGPLRQRASSRLEASYDNATAGWTTGTLYLGVRADGFAAAPWPPASLRLPPALGAVSPVPEPGTAALTLCGLGVVAGAARAARRRGTGAA